MYYFLVLLTDYVFIDERYIPKFGRNIKLCHISCRLKKIITINYYKLVYKVYEELIYSICIPLARPLLLLVDYISLPT